MDNSKCGNCGSSDISINQWSGASYCPTCGEKFEPIETTDKGEVKINNIEFWGERKTNNGGMKIYWEKEDGFGVLTVFLNKKGKPIIETEYMGRAFANEVLEELIREADIQE